MKEFTAYMPTKVLFGAGVLNELKNQTLPGEKALILLSDGTSAIKNGYYDRVKSLLEEAGVRTETFKGIEANPLKDTVMKAAAFAQDKGCDFVVMLGGGSVMDAGKAVAAMATNEGDLWDYVNGGTGKGKPLAKAPLPTVAVTTTAGTGSEVDAWGVVSNPETNEKIGFGGDDRLFPTLSIVDPELMLTVPPAYTAYQGFDALFHSTEVYIGNFSNEFSDMVAEKAIEEVAKYLPVAVKDGKNLEARSKVALGNTLSGYAMVYGCTTSEHSIEHAMSAYHHNLPHGAGLIMISLAFYEHFIKKGACPERFVKMAKLMGKEDAEKAEDFLKALKKLQHDCGVADLKMSDYGIKETEFEKIAVNARETMGGLFASDPLPLTDADVVEILKKSYK